MTATTKARPLFDPPIVRRALVDAFRKLDSARQVRNPVMFTVFVGSILTTGLGHPGHLTAPARSRPAFILAASPPGCGSPCCLPTLPRRWPKGAARPRPTRCAPRAEMSRQEAGEPRTAPTSSPTSAAALRKDDVVLVEAGDLVPGDGEVIEGVASVDESAITGESARSSAKAAATAAASPAARASCPIGWSCASPPIPAKPFWTA